MSDSGIVNMDRSPYQGSSGSGGGDGMSDRVTRLEGHFEYIRRDIDEINSSLKGINSKLADVPTKDDLWSWKVQYTAISVGALAIIVGGIVGGLSWIKPDAGPPAPVVITLPPQTSK